ncbi:MAG: hypothetical protein KatS3mg131_2693 [Candidatus Tectimicrobiota bacterium]|nr:MAG: hypothetical protein KatS3mg131_2693 [Candidatus Tectomicrobia bacterium]
MVTDLAILGFDPETGRMQVEALHPGVTRQQVQAQTGFELLFAPEVAVTEPPRPQELAALRHLDPERLYTA